MRHETSVGGRVGRFWPRVGCRVVGSRVGATGGITDGGWATTGGWCSAVCSRSKTRPADVLPAKLQVELISTEGGKGWGGTGPARVALYPREQSWYPVRSGVLPAAMPASAALSCRSAEPVSIRSVHYQLCFEMGAESSVTCASRESASSRTAQYRRYGGNCFSRCRDFPPTFFGKRGAASVRTCKP